MYCTQCGFELEDQDLFCAKCGKSVRAGCAPAAGPAERLSRPMDQKKLAGVCAGLARYAGTDVTLMRLLWVAMTLLSGGIGFIVYIAAWMIMPKDYPAPATRSQQAPAQAM